jgi:adenine-specific DNA-methyltransferase
MNPADKKVDYIRHDNEGRVNIPTQELKGFVAQDEGRETKKLYPRDPSLDP